MRRAVATTFAAFVTLALAAGCSSDDAAETIVERASDGKVQIDDDGKKITVKGEDGEGTISFGEETELPDDFPEDDVPLPDGGSVRAAISGEQSGKQTFSLTYAIDGDDVSSAADDYRSKLENAGFEIERSTQVGSGDAGFNSFQAVGTDWDVYVFSAGGTGGDQGAFSIQVSTHDDSSTP
jgi:hypothetical protein